MCETYTVNSFRIIRQRRSSFYSKCFGISPHKNSNRKKKERKLIFSLGFFSQTRVECVPLAKLCSQSNAVFLFHVNSSAPCYIFRITLRSSSKSDLCRTDIAFSLLKNLSTVSCNSRGLHAIQKTIQLILYILTNVATK